MAVHYSSSEYGALNPSIRSQVDDAAKTEFGHVPIVQEYKWAEPTYSFVATEGEFLVASVNLVAREVLWGKLKVDAAGVNNLVTHKKYRGRGHGRELMEMAMRFAFASMGAKAGILFCADDLVPFYASLGWKRTDAKVLFNQPSGQCYWTSNRMWIAESSAITEPQQIDLGGLPW